MTALGEQLEAIRVHAEKCGYTDPSKDTKDAGFNDLLDRAVLTILEGCKRDYPKLSAIETFDMALATGYGDEDLDFNFVAYRFLETKVMVEQFREGTSEVKARLRPELKKRGMIG